MDDDEKDIAEFAEDVADFFDDDSFDPHDEFFNDWEGR